MKEKIRYRQGFAWLPRTVDGNIIFLENYIIKEKLVLGTQDGIPYEKWEEVRETSVKRKVVAPKGYDRARG